MLELEWEINMKDNTVELCIYDVVFSASVDYFNAIRTFVKDTYWNDGIQEITYDKEINIMDMDSEFTIDEIISCFEKVPNKHLEIIFE